MAGIEALIDFLFGWIKWLRFWDVVRQFERACLYRFGRVTRELAPGFHFIIPLGVHAVIKYNVVIDTVSVASRTPTKDGLEVAASCVVAWSVKDLTKFLNEVEGGEASIVNLVAPAIRQVLSQMTWEEITTSPPEVIDETILRAVRSRQPGRWGVEVNWASLSELSKVRTFRLLQGHGAG